SRRAPSSAPRLNVASASGPRAPSRRSLPSVSQQTETLLRLLARGLFYAGVVVLLVSVIGATEIFTSKESVIGAPELEAEGRTAAGLFALGAGVTGAGILAGLGGIIVALLGREAER